MSADFHYFVEGRWPFPLDMLRRDSSRATTPDDQRKIDLLSREIDELGDTSEERRLFRRDVVRVNLVIPDAGRRMRPLTPRWESFGWSVPEDETNRLAATMNGERARLEALNRSAMSKLTKDEQDAVRWAVLDEVV